VEPVPRRGAGPLRVRAAVAAPYASGLSQGAAYAAMQRHEHCAQASACSRPPVVRLLRPSAIDHPEPGRCTTQKPPQSAPWGASCPELRRRLPRPSPQPRPHHLERAWGAGQGTLTGNPRLSTLLDRCALAQAITVGNSRRETTSTNPRSGLLSTDAGGVRAGLHRRAEPGPPNRCLPFR